jgi:iron complex transport system ATP-binding protein
MTETTIAHVNDDLVIETQCLTVTRGQVAVLKDLNLKITKGRWYAIVGPNGAGKSTLLQVMSGLLPFNGELHLFGQPLKQQSQQSRARRIAWLAQGSVQSANDLTAYDVVMLGRIPHQSWLGNQSQADHAAVERAFALTNAWHLRNRLLSTLSGGEKQRVLLARVLAVEAEILLMDEPLVNLDPSHQADWLALLRQLIAQGKTILSVLHEITIALYADELIVMSNGEIHCTGDRDNPVVHRTIEKIFENRIAIRSFANRWIALPNLE